MGGSFRTFTPVLLKQIEQGTRFSDTWLFDPVFLSWIAKDNNYLTKFRCCLCGGRYELVIWDELHLFHMQGERNILQGLCCMLK